MENLLNSVDQNSSANYSLQGKCLLRNFPLKTQRKTSTPSDPPFPSTGDENFCPEVSQYKNIIIILVPRLSSIFPPMKIGVIRSPQLNSYHIRERYHPHLKTPYSF